MLHHPLEFTPMPCAGWVRLTVPRVPIVHHAGVREHWLRLVFALEVMSDRGCLLATAYSRLHDQPTPPESANQLPTWRGQVGFLLRFDDGGARVTLRWRRCDGEAAMDSAFTLGSPHCNPLIQTGPEVRLRRMPTTAHPTWTARLHAVRCRAARRHSPAVRHLALRWLLDRPADIRTPRAQKAAMGGTRSRDPAAQHPDGYGRAGPGYATKYRAQLATHLPRQLGADPANAQVRSACEYVLAHTQAPAAGSAHPDA